MSTKKITNPWSDNEVAKQITRRVWWGAGFATAAAGVLFGGCGLWGHFVWHGGFCEAVWKSPPWILFSGLATVPALLLLWRWRTTQKAADIATATQQAETAEGQRALFRQQHASERFSAAIGLISHENELVQVGGIHALEALALQVPSEYGVPVRKTLCSYIRDSLGQKQQGQPIVRRDMAVPAALVALGKLGPGDSRDGVDLSNVNLGPVNLHNADFSYATLTDVVLSNSVLSLNLKGAYLSGAKLDSCDLRYSNFEDASIGHATLVDADCREVNFSRAYMCGADVTRAQLNGANLDGTDLGDVTGLTQAQLDGTIGQPAVMPPGLSKAGMKRPE